LSEETFKKIVHVWSQVIPDLQPHQDVLTKFIYLIEKIDGLPDMERRFHREGLSFYHAISKKRTISDLEEALKVFFDESPLSTVAAPEETASQGMSAERLGGVQNEQILYVKKLGEAEFYGALWPWKDKEDVVTVHLGVCSPDLTEDNHEFMYSAMKGHLTETTSEKIDTSVRGRIQGISLSSFLQMSEMEGSTCTLKVHAGNRIGNLHLLNGNLIDAETGSLKHRDAAYTILSWENAEIDIQKPSGRKKNEINLPLMHILMEALKKKDEFEFEMDSSEAEAGIQGDKGDGQTISQPDSDGAADGPAAPEPVDDAGGVHQADDGAGGTEPAPQLEPDPSDAPEEKKEDDALAGETVPDRKVEVKKKKTGKPKPLGPIGKKKRTPLIAAVVVIILLAGGIAFWALKGGTGGSAAEDYAVLMEKLERLTDGAKKEKLINAFIDSHTDDPEYTDKAMQALFNLMSQLEASDYEKAVAAVFDLPLDSQYHQKAEDIFNGFLERHPESHFRDDISKRLTEIDELTDDARFGELSDLSQRDYIGQLEASYEYIGAYPDGKHRAAVEQFAREALQASYREFSTKIQKCKRKKTWDDCLAICRQYKDSFQRYMNMAPVDKIEAELLERQALDKLKAETEGADDATVRKRYLAFLKTYPDSSERSRLEQRVAEIEKKLSNIDEWQRVQAIGQDTTKSLSHRISVVRRYIDQNPLGPYSIEAENFLWNLEQQSRAGTTGGSSTRTGKGGTQTAPPETVSTEQDNAARLERLKQKVIADLAKNNGRFVASKNGTVRDGVTGLDWTMLDSSDVMGQCVDYRQAVAYVKQLQDGGHNDWRMPTSAELTSIYQNRPYFPAGTAEWYWSSEVYEKGYQTIANIVNAKPEAVYRRRTAEVRKCGSVRAVRP